ncbi:MAG: PDZ domain-containing protein [Candidatus Methylomirabilales bacterium]
MGRTRASCLTALAVMGIVAAQVALEVRPVPAAHIRVPANALRTPEYGWLGIGIRDVGEDLSYDLSVKFGVLEGNGVLVAEALPDGPAEKVGLKSGDVIIQVGSQRVWEVKDLQRVVRHMAVGDEVTLVILRNGDRLSVPIRVARMPQEAADGLAAEPFGLIVRGFDAELAERLGLGRQGGIRVVVVERGSPAERAGLQPGDLLLNVDGRDLVTAADYAAAFREPAGSVTLRLLRSGNPLTVTLERPGLTPQQ